MAYISIIESQEARKIILSDSIRINKCVIEWFQLGMFSLEFQDQYPDATIADLIRWLKGWKHRITDTRKGWLAAKKVVEEKLLPWLEKQPDHSLKVDIDNYG